jgi:regulator of sirC expression with transglutaminase-like and TPR domain
LALGRSLDLPLVPVFLPGHIFVRLENPATGPRSIETLRGGIARSDSFYRETFSLAKRPWYRLESTKPEQALAALVFNLGNAHLAAGNRTAAEEEFRLVEEALPGFPEALGSRGACAMLDGESGLAREKFRAALAGDSLSEPAQRNLAALDRAAGGP